MVTGFYQQTVHKSSCTHTDVTPACVVGFHPHPLIQLARVDEVTWSSACSDVTWPGSSQPSFNTERSVG